METQHFQSYELVVGRLLESMFFTVTLFYHFYFQAQLVGGWGYTLSDILGELVQSVSILNSPVRFLSRRRTPRYTNMEIILRCFYPPSLANVWREEMHKHARPDGLSALLAATSAGLSTVISNAMATQLQFVEPQLRY